MKANTQNVRLYYPYKQYTNLFIFWFKTIFYSAYAAHYVYITNPAFLLAKLLTVYMYVYWWSTTSSKRNQFSNAKQWQKTYVLPRFQLTD